MWNTSRESLLTNKLWGRSADAQISVVCWALTRRCQTNVYIQHRYPFFGSVFRAKVLIILLLRWVAETHTHLESWITGTLPLPVRSQVEGKLFLCLRFPSCLFKVGSGLNSCQKRLWKCKTILAPSSSFFFFFFISCGCFGIEEQKLSRNSVCASCASFYIVCSCKGSWRKYKVNKTSKATCEMLE